MFVTIYKTLLLVQKQLNGGKELDIHSFFAGIAGGYYVFGANNNINQQVYRGMSEHGGSLLYVVLKWVMV